MPAEIDPLTGYRAYRYEQLAALDRILALRDPGFSLAETRALLAGGPDAIEACLLQHRHRLAAEVARQAARLRRLTALQRAVAADPRAPELGVRVRVIEDVRALALRSRPDSISALFEEAEARAARDRIDSSPFLLLHGPREVEVCVPVRPSSRLRGVREVRGAPLAASITYAGSYAQTAALGARMATWLRRSGLREAGPLREVYHRFGADQRGYRLPERRLVASSDQFVTELQIPAEEFHAAYLFDHLTPVEVMRRRPHLAGVWYDGPDSQYGRPARFYQQLQALDLAAAWGRIHVPALVVWGEYDFIMDRSDQEQIVRLVGPQRGFWSCRTPIICLPPIATPSPRSGTWATATTRPRRRNRSSRSSGGDRTKRRG